MIFSMKLYTQTAGQIVLKSCSNQSPKDDPDGGPTAWRWACLGRTPAARGGLGTSRRRRRNGRAAAELGPRGRRGRGSGGGHAAPGLAFRSRTGGRRKERSPSNPGPGAPQPRLYPGLRHRPLCVPAPAPEAPQPAALTSLIGSADGFIDWLPCPPARAAASRYDWTPELPFRPSREVIARPLGVPGSSSGKPRVLLGSRLCP